MLSKKFFLEIQSTALIKIFYFLQKTSWISVNVRYINWIKFSVFQFSEKFIRNRPWNIWWIVSMQLDYSYAL